MDDVHETELVPTLCSVRLDTTRFCQDTLALIWAVWNSCRLDQIQSVFFQDLYGYQVRLVLLRQLLLSTFGDPFNQGQIDLELPIAYMDNIKTV